jgi:hypothetical protein
MRDVQLLGKLTGKRRLAAAAGSDDADAAHDVLSCANVRTTYKPANQR